MNTLFALKILKEENNAELKGNIEKKTMKAGYELSWHFFTTLKSANRRTADRIP